MMTCLSAIHGLAGAVLLAGASVVLGAGPATGSPARPEHTVTLAVDNLKGGCPSCAFIVERALSRIDGVLRVEVSARTGTAVVVYDAARTGVAALTKATAAAGFPAAPLE